MKISKIKVIAKYISGGVGNVVEYLLELFNEMIAKLPAEEVAKYAQLVKDIANFVNNLTVLISDEKKRAAASATAQALGDLALALVDSKFTTDEFTSVMDEVTAAIEAWKRA